LLNLIRFLTTRYYIKGIYRILWLLRNGIARNMQQFRVTSRIKLYLNRNHYYQWMIACTGYYAFGVRKIIETYLEPGDLFVDVGCNIGYISLLAGSIVGDHGTVLSFDPDPRAVRGMRENVKLNNMNNIVFIGKACSDSTGNAIFNIASLCGWSTAVNDTPGLEIEKTIHIEKTTLDNEINKISINKPPKLIKIDVEGYEPYVLGGATTIIEKQETAFIIEINNRRLQGNGHSIDDVLNKFNPFHYYAYWIEEKRSLVNSLNDIRLKEINFSHRNSGKDGDILVIPSQIKHHPMIGKLKFYN